MGNGVNGASSMASHGELENRRREGVRWQHRQQHGQHTLGRHAHPEPKWSMERAAVETPSRSLGHRPRERLTLKVARVRDDGGELLELLESVGHGFCCTGTLRVVSDDCGPRNGDADGGNAVDGSSGRAYKSSARRLRVSRAGFGWSGSPEYALWESHARER